MTKEYLDNAMTLSIRIDVLENHLDMIKNSVSIHRDFIGLVFLVKEEHTMLVDFPVEYIDFNSLKENAIRKIELELKDLKAEFERL